MTVEKALQNKSIIEFRLGRKRYHFSPRPLATLATALLLPFLIMLGFWQLHRAETKRDIISLYRANSAAIPTEVKTTFASGLPKPFEKLMVRGHFLKDTQILLDNRFHEHQVGYEVMTPFKLNNSDTLLLINRGWIPRNQRRSIFPVIETPADEQTLTLMGLASYPSARHFLLGTNNEHPREDLHIIQHIDIEELRSMLAKPLYPFVLLLDEQQDVGFVRNWNPINMTPDVHQGYAVQWFALAASLLIMYLFVNLKSEQLHD